jgi:hypothetical protein
MRHQRRYGQAAKYRAADPTEHQIDAGLRDTNQVRIVLDGKLRSDAIRAYALPVSSVCTRTVL